MKESKWYNRGAITMVALMVMLIFAIYGIALYGRSVSAYHLQELEIQKIQNVYSGDLERAYEIADSFH